jgi:hypothetical protein
MKIGKMNLAKLRLSVATLFSLFSLAVSAAGGSTCDRACLEGYVDKYFAAVIDNDPARIPLAPDVRFTENGQKLTIGDGLWNTLKATGPYRLFVTDPEAGQVALFTTIEEDHREPGKGTPALMALRLKIKNAKITQIEQFIVRNEDAAKRVAAMGQPHAVYLEAIPGPERMSRADLIKTADYYFAGMQQNDGKGVGGTGTYPFTADCDRYENGSRSTNAPTPAGETKPDPKTASVYSGQWSCLEQFQSGLIHFVNRIRDRRFVAVDRERGIVFSFAFFDHPGGATRTFQTPDGRTVTAGPVQPWTWQLAELFKIEKGKIRRIEAILERCPYGMNAGWSSWEDGMSDKPRDVTME